MYVSVAPTLKMTSNVQHTRILKSRPGERDNILVYYASNIDPGAVQKFRIILNGSNSIKQHLVHKSHHDFRSHLQSLRGIPPKAKSGIFHRVAALSRHHGRHGDS